MSNLLTELNTYLPSYEIRLFCILFFMLLLLLSILVRVINKKKYSIITSFAFLAVYISLPLLLLFLPNNPFSKENILLLSVYIFSFFSELIYLLLLYFRKVNIKAIYIFNWVLLSLSVLVILTLSLFGEPKVYSQAVSGQGILEESESIQIHFTVPINKENLKIHISPESNTNIEYYPFLNSKTWVNGFKIVPSESFLPDQKIVVYTTGITRIFPSGIQHENSQEFFTPSTPEVEEVVLGADTNNVGINEPIVLELDSKDQKFVEWEILFTPEVQHEIVRSNSEKISIIPSDLKQGTEYTLMVYRNIIRYDTQTKEKISQESNELVKELNFKTISAPGIKGFNRDGVFIPNKDPLIVTFQDQLEESSIDGKISIQPSIDGDIKLSEDLTQIVFQPKTEFTKNTEYTFKIGQGIKNILGGYIEEDINIVFRTPGPLKLKSASPWNSAKDININTKTMYLTFDQPVNKESIEQNFKISPNISGTFSWKGNTLYYSLRESLSSGTKYTVTLPSGVKSLYGLDSVSEISTSFTTKPETVLLNIPLYYQSESFTCNLAAARMVLAYKGISASEGGIRDSIGVGQNPANSWVDGYGVHAGPLSSYISSRGVSNTIKSGWSLTGVLQEVKAGHPVLLYLYNGYSVPYGQFELEGGYTGYKGMHSEVVIGFVGRPESPQSIITNDPWRGKRTYSPSTLLSKWAYMGNTAIVIY